MRTFQYSNRRLTSLLLAVCFVTAIAACSRTLSNNSAAAPSRLTAASETSLNDQNNSTATTAVVKALKANLRDKPARSGAIVTEVKKNDRLTVLDGAPTGPWYRVRETQVGSEGWIHGNVIALNPTNAAIAQAKPRTETRQVAAASPISSGRSYINVDGERVRSPVFSKAAPAGASARCGDGSYSFSQNRRGTCSHHGGVAEWL